MMIILFDDDCHDDDTDDNYARDTFNGGESYYYDVDVDVDDNVDK